MTAIEQTPDTNLESQRLADNLLPRAANVFRAHEQRIYRCTDRLREITHDEKGQMQQLIDLYLVETAPMLDGLGEAIQTNSSGEVVRIAHELVGYSFCWELKRSPDRCANWNDSPTQATSRGTRVACRCSSEISARPEGLHATCPNTADLQFITHEENFHACQKEIDPDRG